MRSQDLPPSREPARERGRLRLPPPSTSSSGARAGTDAGGATLAAAACSPPLTSPPRASPRPPSQFRSAVRGHSSSCPCGRWSRSSSGSTTAITARLRHLTADEVPALIGWAATSAAAPGPAAAADARRLPRQPRGGEVHGDHACRRGRNPLAGATAVVELDAARARRHDRRRDRPAVDAPQDRALPRHALRARGRAPPRRLSAAARRGHEALLEVANQVDRIIVATDEVDTDLIAELNTICRRRQVKLSVVSPLRGGALPSLQISQLADLPILEYNTWDASRSSLLIKRTFDCASAGRGSAAVRALHPDRGARDQARFARARLLLAGPRRSRRPALPDVQVPDDARRRRGGARRDRQPRGARRPDVQAPGRPSGDAGRGGSCGGSSIDEVPQLFNVLVGEMSDRRPAPRAGRDRRALHHRGSNPAHGQARRDRPDADLRPR